MSFTADTGPALSAHLKTFFNTSDLVTVALRCNRRSRLVAPIIPNNNGGITKKISNKKADETRNKLRRVLRFHHYQEMQQRMKENAEARVDDPPPAAAEDEDDEDDDDIMMLDTDDEDDEELEAECSRKLVIANTSVEGDEDDDEWMNAMQVDVVPLDATDDTFNHSIEFEGEEDEREEEEVEGALAFDSDVTPTATPTKPAYLNLSWEEEECRTPVLDDAALQTPTGVSQYRNDYFFNTANGSTSTLEFLFESDGGEAGKGAWLEGGYYDETIRAEEFV
ncbi:hypothetical protein BC629DRAFT_1553175 [Irpex lacteus]|nr:hypothetical protein BC629DRAFT_1553175 [Irpex lacteus]